MYRYTQPRTCWLTFYQSTPDSIANPLWNPRFNAASFVKPSSASSVRQPCSSASDAVLSPAFSYPAAAHSLLNQLHKRLLIKHVVKRKR
jgi:hypothetical protein